MDKSASSIHRTALNYIWQTRHKSLISGSNLIPHKGDGVEDAALTALVREAVVERKITK